MYPPISVKSLPPKFHPVCVPNSQLHLHLLHKNWSSLCPFWLMALHILPSYHHHVHDQKSQRATASIKYTWNACMHATIYAQGKLCIPVEWSFSDYKGKKSGANQKRSCYTRQTKTDKVCFSWNTLDIFRYVLVFLLLVNRNVWMWKKLGKYIASLHLPTYYCALTLHKFYEFLLWSLLVPHKTQHIDIIQYIKWSNKPYDTSNGWIYSVASKNIYKGFMFLLLPRHLHNLHHSCNENETCTWFLFPTTFFVVKKCILIQTKKVLAVHIS